jgi:prepilin-type N-terminal cleavage/methylation domain-containing protein
MRGFTLVETIVYIALLGILMTGAVMMSYHIVQSSSNVSSKNTVQEEGNFVMSKISWALSGVSNSMPAFSGYPNNITIQRYDGNTTKFKWMSNGSQKWIENSELNKNSGAFASTTTNNVNVSMLQFHYIPASGTAPAGIEASTTVNGVTFSMTHYIRK